MTKLVVLSKFDGSEDSIKIRLGEIQEGVLAGRIEARISDTLI